ncbi:hypothetical protein STRIP9103_05401 [Streptomyces ipomoeae 91-03]|uniref:Uncharacterized protein n=1 Tax=Streptomyces ipomoeae 91-03 TaxID=698759 RepID=L1L7A0_9ACTN|nr:hypothetical protein STRIP9103_05401 [Streptomyces ipomoeae 91-03]
MFGVSGPCRGCASHPYVSQRQAVFHCAQDATVPACLVTTHPVTTHRTTRNDR